MTLKLPVALITDRTRVLEQTMIAQRMEAIPSDIKMGEDLAE